MKLISFFLRVWGFHCIQNGTVAPFFFHYQKVSSPGKKKRSIVQRDSIISLNNYNFSK